MCGRAEVGKMRRTLGLLSVVALLLGLELSTEAVSLSYARFQAGFQALIAGVDFHVTPMRFGGGILAVAVGLSMGGLVIWSAGVRRKVDSVGSLCPDCGNETKRVKRTNRQSLLSYLVDKGLTRRKCEICGWQGLSLRR